jgi:hypothetical protein
MRLRTSNLGGSAAALVLIVGATLMVSSPAGATLHTDNTYIQQSLCVGFDCVNGSAFNFDTIRLQENNLRIRFQDTSVGSFPTNDWQIVINDTASGGASFFAVEDADAGRQVFKIEAGANSNSLYVDTGGRVGFGTSTPVVNLHVVSGNTPTLRLEQNGSSGFSPQTWDVAGNETNFFVRDVTNGSKLPLRIRPNAPSNSIFLDTNGNVGMGTASPMSGLGGAANGVHIVRSGSSEILFALQGSGPTTRFTLNNTNDTTGSGTWSVGARQNTNFIITRDGSGFDELSLTPAGDLTVRGNCTEVDGACADYVFEPDYELMPLDELASFVKLNKHLPNVPSTADIQANGLNIQHFQGRLLEKIEELTLHTLAQQEVIETLQARLDALEATAPQQ